MSALTATAAPPPVSPDVEAQRRRELATVRRRATALFFAVTALYLAIRLGVDDRSGGVGYVQAFAEAAMIGALADWFAVTALFRHPLRIPIPHTAIIPNRKDQIGRGLGDFVQANFLNDAVLGTKLREAALAARLGEYLADREVADRLGDTLADAVGGLRDAVAGENLRAAVNDTVLDQVRATPITPLVSRAIDIAVEGGHHRTLFDAILRGAGEFLAEQRLTLRQRLDEESPWWVPETIDDRLFEKIYSGVTAFLTEVGDTPDHPVRAGFEQQVDRLIVRLREEPELIARGESLKEEILNHPEMEQWTSRMWDNLQNTMVRESADSDSPLRRALEEIVVALGTRLTTDTALQQKVDDWLVSALLTAVERFRPEIGELIGATVDTWDARETSDRLELLLGRDLQFIRINGTVVGGTAGLVIHTLSEAIG